MKAAVGALAALVAAALFVAVPLSPGASPDGRPNVVVIVTDDQTLSEMSGLPATRSLVGAAGVTFSRAYASYPLCCPARATLLNGRYSHNHNVRGNSPPNGGYAALNEGETVPVWLHDAGYRTVHVGKYLNGYAVTSAPFVPPGWDEWYGKTGTTDGLATENHYYNYSMYEQGPTGLPQLVRYGQAESDYQTDVYREKAIDAVNRLGGPGSSAPFYLSVNFGAPHWPYTPPPRFGGTLLGHRLPKLAGFDERDLSDKPKFMRQKKRSIPRSIKVKIGLRRHLRLEQLLSVDEAIASIFEALLHQGELDNTYIVFTSDNGYLNGEHRINKGKYLPHEPSSHVPLMIRGPGLPAGTVSRELVGNMDVAPTVLELAGSLAVAQAPGNFIDGRSLLPFAANPGLRTTRPLLLEGDRGTLEGEEPSGDPTAVPEEVKLSNLAGVNDLEQEPGARVSARARRAGINSNILTFRAPAYRAIRTDRYLFVRYANKASELYDMQRDPAQLRSVHRDPRYAAVRAFLTARLTVLEGCVAGPCAAAIGPDPAPSAGAAPKAKGEGGKGKKTKPKKRKAGSGR